MRRCKSLSRSGLDSVLSLLSAICLAFSSSVNSACCFFCELLSAFEGGKDLDLLFVDDAPLLLPFPVFRFGDLFRETDGLKDPRCGSGLNVGVLKIKTKELSF